MIYDISHLRTKLQWLLIKSRILYKMFLTIHTAYHRNTPDYLANLLHACIIIYEKRQINELKFKTPVLSNITSVQYKYFSIHAPNIWNYLPYSIQPI